MRIYTIGHSTHCQAAFISLLRDTRINCIADVRSFPRSRRNPQFNREILEKALQAAGIGYRHFAALGGRRGPKDVLTPSPNGAWRETAFRNYADYAMSTAFRTALAELRDLAAQQQAAIMCAEAVWWRCHRRIITDHLIALGDDVVHVLPPGRLERAAMSESAIIQPDGGVVYPPAQSNLL